MKVEEARNRSPASTSAATEVKIEDSQLPTPPAETSALVSYTGANAVAPFIGSYSLLSYPDSEPPPLDELPNFEASQYDNLLQSNRGPNTENGDIFMRNGFGVFRSANSTPSSSVGAEADVDDMGTISPHSSFENESALLSLPIPSQMRRRRRSYSNYDSFANSPDPSETDVSRGVTHSGSTDSEADDDADRRIPSEWERSTIQNPKHNTRGYDLPVTDDWPRAMPLADTDELDVEVDLIDDGVDEGGALRMRKFGVAANPPSELGRLSPLAVPTSHQVEAGDTSEDDGASKEEKIEVNSSNISPKEKGSTTSID